MQFGWVKYGGAITAAALALLAGPPLSRSADDAANPAAEQLDKRTKPAETAGGQSQGLSDSAVRVLLTYAYSILPEQAPGPDGKMAKIDRSDANKFLIPTEDARRVIRAATRSAYAEACQLLELERANYQTFMKGEEAKKTWTHEQLLMINALHMFSVSYFAGTITITAKEEPNGAQAGAPADDKTPPAESGAQAAGAAKVLSPKKPECPPEQKQKVTNAINAYIASAKAAAPEAPPPAPLAGGAN
jgi:hypothetical protein